MKIIDKITKFLYTIIGKNPGFNPDKQDPRDYEIMGSLIPYKPMKEKVDLTEDLLEIKNQTGQNTCVCESGATCKEGDEGIILDPQDMAIELRKRGVMSATGTSLSAFQSALRDRGIAERGFLPNNYATSWWNFSNPSLQTQEIIDNAKIHKSKAFFKTYDIDKVLELLDKRVRLQTGADWYSGYNSLRNPWLLTPYSGYLTGGHAFSILGYNLNYQGYKVLICLNSYGKETYDNGKFYVKFEDFNKVFKYGVYWNEDLDKDKASFVSINQRRAIKEINSPRVWYIEGVKKRYVPDEAIMTMLEVNPMNLVIDHDNILPSIPEGTPISFQDIPLDKRENFKYLLQQRQDLEFLKDRYSKYYPDIFN